MDGRTTPTTATTSTTKDPSLPKGIYLHTNQGLNIIIISENTNNRQTDRSQTKVE